MVDPEFRKQKEIIQTEKAKISEVVQVIKNDAIMQKDSVQKRLAERKRRIAAKKGFNVSGGSFLSEITSPIIPKSKEFEPILKDMDGEPKVVECEDGSDEDTIIKISEVKLSPSRDFEKGDKNYSETNFNEISAINNTTIGPDTSMNTSQL